jgi:hypothetical protein
MESAIPILTSHYDLSKTGLTDAMAAATHNETAPTMFLFLPKKLNS